MTCRMSLRRPSMGAEERLFHPLPPHEGINVSKRVPPMNRLVVVVATVGVFAFVAATVIGVFRPAVHLLAGTP
jgi:hypothetical protein